MTQTDIATQEDAAAPLVQLRTQLEQRAEEFRMVLPSHIKPEKLQRTILTAAQLNPALLQCDRRSFLTACMKAAQDGLLPDGRDAAIVPFNQRTKGPQGWQSIKVAQYLPMLAGLRKKMLQSGEIKDIIAQVVYRQEIEAGRFVYEEGTQRILRHRPILEPDFKPSDADIAVAYSVATFVEGPPSFEVMRRFQIDEVREASQTGALFDENGKPRQAKGPWVEWFPEMAKKTVVRRHSKSLPQSSDIIDIEAQEIERASQSAALLLDSNRPDAPRVEIEQREQFEPEGPFDLTGGEISGTLTNEPEPAAAPVEPEATPEPEALVDEPDEPPVEPEADVDDEQQATIFIDRAARCELLIDLKRLEEDADVALAAMPAELVDLVEAAFAAARRRLTPKARTKADASAE